MSELSTSDLAIDDGVADGLPAVSIVMPVRNEAKFIARSVQAILEQDYAGSMEVVCVDGMSDDDTRQIISRIAAQDPRVRLVDNPRQITPTALNIGIRAARYSLIVIMGGHTNAPPNFVHQCVLLRQQTGADLVGGQIIVKGETRVASAIAAAMESKFGVGPARWRGGGQAGETDTVPFGLWERKRMLELGGFDETLVRNQDYELNYRLRAAGGRIYFSPEIKTIYYSRQNIAGLRKQYYQYGLWKAQVIAMHPASTRPRHIVAPLFVAGLPIGALLSLLLGGIWLWTFASAVAVYAALIVLFSIVQAARHGWGNLVLLPLLFPTLHIAWGTGFWSGIWRWWIKSRVSSGQN